MDRLVKVVAHDGTATLYEYDANGNRTAVRYANGMIVKYEYDTVNRLVLEKALDKDANVVVQYSYTLGAAGERTKVVEAGETELKTVLKVFVHSVDEILHLHTNEGDIDTTTNHPFYVVGKGWTAAGDLAEGDEIYNLDGTTSVVLGFEIEKLDECVLVYNLEVDDFHSYFVGDVPVLVHNSYGGKEPLPSVDSTGKVHGKLPTPDELKNYSKEELTEFCKDLENSVRKRIEKNIELGPDPGHGERQHAEQQLIHTIRKILGF